MRQYVLNSRMPVRMALAVLAAEGLVRQRARHGFWIAQVDERIVKQVAALLAETEVVVVRALHVALTHSGVQYGVRSDLLGGAEGNLKSMRYIATKRLNHSEIVDSETEANFAVHETGFHHDLGLAGGYDIAARHIVQWRNLMRLFRLQHGVRHVGSALRLVCEEHDELWNALRKSGPVSLGDIVRRHVAAALHRSNPETALAEPAGAGA